MAHKTKAARAAYMRKWRERQKAAQPAPESRLGSPLIEKTHTEPEVAEDGPYMAAVVGSAIAPAFLASPVDECPVCGHDRQESDHLGGRPCKFKTSPRRNCGCVFEGF
jgi:hypothetical protein